MDTAIEEFEVPHKIVERGMGGRVNRIPQTTVWEVLEGPGGLSGSESPTGPSRRTRSTRRSRRLGDRALRGAWLAGGDAPSVTCSRGRAEPGPIVAAGGNRYATGIP